MKKEYVIQQPCIVILAAGNAVRMGEPKLLLMYRNKTLITHAIEAAVESGIVKILIVTGAYRQLIENEIKDQELIKVFNDQWNLGMSSSVKAGLTAAAENWPEMDGVLFMVADQPYISGIILKEIISVQQETGSPVAASLYGNSFGTPAIFHKSIFNEFDILSGDHGARKIILNHRDELATVNFEAGATDIDTAAEYEQLLREDLKPGT